VPAHHPDAAPRHRLPARHCAVRPPVGPDGRRSNHAREELNMRRASPGPALLPAAVALVAGTATLWPRDHPIIAPAGVPAPTATQPAPDPGAGGGGSP